VIENSTRFYRVFATNSGGKSPPSNVSSATTPATPPTQPTNLTATAGRRKISLKWTASTDAGGSGLAGYEIWRSATGVGGSFAKIATTSSTSYTNSNLVSGQTYWYYVIAYDGANNVSTPSNTASSKAL
jgi:predicted phage tail protein